MVEGTRVHAAVPGARDAAALAASGASWSARARAHCGERHRHDARARQRMKDGRADERALMARCSERGSVVDGNRDRDQEEREVLSVHEVLRVYEQPLNEEQAWAVCYQSCRGARAARHSTGWYRTAGPESLLLHRDGTVSTGEIRGCHVMWSFSSDLQWNLETHLDLLISDSGLFGTCK